MHLDSYTDYDEKHGHFCDAGMYSNIPEWSIEDANYRINNDNVTAYVNNDGLTLYIEYYPTLGLYSGMLRQLPHYTCIESKRKYKSKMLVIDAFNGLLEHFDVGE